MLAYVVRHGRTDMSPQPEWWSQIPLNDLGVAQAHASAEFLKGLKVRPDWVVSSDLKRAEQTGEICAQELGIRFVKPMADIRALDKDESASDFEKRNARGFAAIFKTAEKSKTIPLIACHRSNTAFLSKLLAGVRQKIDYREASAIYEGGILQLFKNYMVPLYKVVGGNPRENFDPGDGTAVSGFVTAQANEPPRWCGHCKWMEGPACINEVVKADDEVGLFFKKRRNAAGYWLVDHDDCCNKYQHKFKGSGAGA